MIEAAVPEQADGGYWYRVPVELIEGVRWPAGIGNIPFCGWDLGDEYVIRVLMPITDLPTLSSSGIAAHLEALGYSVKPTARIGGL